MSNEDSMQAYREHPYTARALKVMTNGNTRATLHIPPAPPYMQCFWNWLHGC